MTHNPIRGPHELPRWPFAHLEVPIGSVGVLYKDGCFECELGPDTKVSLIDRAMSKLKIYFVDKQAHLFTWNVRLPCRGDQHLFRARISLDYRVTEPRRMIEEQVKDTERLVVRELEPVLRRESCRLDPNQHQRLHPRLVRAITSNLFDSLGLKLNRPADVIINLDAKTHGHIKNLEDIKQAEHIPQQVTHHVRLPSKDPARDFEGSVAVTYKVTDRNQLPTDVLAKAEQMLWHQVESYLFTISSRFGTDQVQQAQQEMLVRTNTHRFKGYGLETVSVQVAIGLEKGARARAEELAQIKHDAEVATQRLAMQTNALRFYESGMKQGKDSLLVLLLSLKPEERQTILSDLEEREQAVKTIMEMLQGPGGQQEPLADDGHRKP